MKPTQPMERSSGAMVRQAGAVVMVGTQMASPRAAAIARRTSSGFMAMSDGLNSDQDRRRAAALPAQPVVLGNQVDVVRALDAGMGDAEGVEQWLAVAHHGVTGLVEVLVPFTTEQADHIEDGKASVHGHAAQRVHGRIESGVLDH